MGSILYSKRHSGVIGRCRKTRPKTFKTEAGLKEYATKNKITEFTVDKLSETKFRINC